VHDSSNAYHSVMLDEESKELCVSKIRLSTGEPFFVTCDFDGSVRSAAVESG
jgi:hypothetical protein